MKKLIVLALAASLASLCGAQTMLYGLNPNATTFAYSERQAGAASVIASNELGQVFLLAHENATITSVGFQNVFDWWYGPQGPDVYQDIRVSVTFFAKSHLTFAGGVLEFSYPVETAVFDFGPMTFPKNTHLTFGENGSPHLQLPHPIQVSGDVIGAQIVWLEDRGNGLVPAQHLALGIDVTNAQTGSNAFVYKGWQWLFVASGVMDSAQSLPQTPPYFQVMGRGYLAMNIYGY